MTGAPRLTAQRIIQLLAEKHAGDVFVPECKDGPTTHGSHRRLDAWAMNRSWSQAAVFGYEVKVSRADFLKDEKWVDYLPMCNCLSFVSPRELIMPEELPQDVGLLWVSKTGQKLFTKRKSVHRDVEIPEGVWRYILMCRAKITREYHSSDRTVAQWKAWLEEKRANRELGYEVRGRIAEIARETQSENAKLKKQMRGYDEFREKLTALGIRPESSVDSWTQDKAIKRLFGEHAPEIVKMIRQLEYPLEQLRKSLEEEIHPDLRAELSRWVGGRS